MRSGTAPAHRRERPAPLAGWLVLVGVMIALAYVSRATGGKPDPQVLYKWSTAVGGLVQDSIILAIVLLLFGSSQLPKLARSLGSASKEFRKGLDEDAEGDKEPPKRAS